MQLSKGFSKCMSLILLAAVGIAAVDVTHSNDLAQVSVTFSIGPKDFTKEISCYKNIPGVVKTKGDKLLFTAYSESLRTLKLKKKVGLPVSARKLREVKTLKKEGLGACTQVVPLPSQTPTPTPAPTPEPGSTPTPTPTATPVPQGNFDLFGNVTEKGKAAFGIPSNFEASITTGKGVHDLKSCGGCHDQKLNKSFSYLREKTKLSPMFYDENSLTDQELAQLTAYLNRFQQN